MEKGWCKGVQQRNWQAIQEESTSCTHLASIPATHGKCLIGTTSLCATHLPLPSVEEQHSHTDGVSVTRTSSFSQDTSGVFAEIKIRTVKRNICEANEKWNTELSRAASVGFRRDKNSGEGRGGGEWKAPNPEAYEKQEPAGWEGQRRYRPGPRDKFKVTCRHPSLHSFLTGWSLQQIPCHILSTGLLHSLLPTNHSLQQFACQGFQFHFPLCLLLLSLLMCGLGQYSCIFPSHFLPLLVASSHTGCPGMLCLPHDPKRFRCFLSNWEYYQKKTWGTVVCKVVLMSIS